VREQEGHEERRNGCFQSATLWMCVLLAAASAAMAAHGTRILPLNRFAFSSSNS